MQNEMQKGYKMVFSSLIFLFGFLPAVLVFYYLPFFKTRSYRNAVLLVASIAFYAWGEPVFVFVMLFSILVNYVLGLRIDKANQTDGNNGGKAGKAKVWLTAAVIWNIGLLFVFKYLSFLAETFRKAANIQNMPVFKIALPIGISFFTFQILSYIIDVYRKHVPVQKNIMRLALYISLFPQLIAGPIVRYETVQDQILNRKETLEGFVKGFERFVIGLGKKCLLANYMAIIADTMFGMQPSDLTLWGAWLGAIAYTLQIYFDFSGYSDMAIGLGLMFGFKFEENFNYPYAARSVTDFWRRWHISLSSWFRDYVYIPLGGNRVSKPRGVFNLFVVWCLTGIWHGANFTFWLWGLYYFVLLQTERTFGLAKKAADAKGFKLVLFRLFTLVLVVLGWVLFRAESVPAAFSYFACMVGKGGAAFEQAQFLLYNSAYVIVAAIFACIPYKELVKSKLPSLFESEKAGNIFYAVRAAVLVVVLAVSILSCIQSTYNPFIYFNF